MSNLKGLKCISCGREYEVKGMQYICEECGGNLEVIYNYKELASHLTRESLAQDTDYSVWRYWDLLPLSDKSNIMPLQIGWTPLYRAERLENKLGLKSLYLKDDGRNPSGSFKDRASSVAICKARELDFKVIAGASTGNAASSTACLSASLGISPTIFVPAAAPEAKVAQLLVFGATVYAVQGTYDEAFDLCTEVCAEYGWFNRNTGYNPYTREGKKTVSFEICEQLNWEVPDTVLVPVGDGNIISGVWKGFKDLYGVGLIDRLPRLIAVQSEKSSAVVEAVLGDGKVKPVEATTVADSISVDLPRDGEAAVKAVRESNGTGVLVPDEKILESILTIARGAGIFAEPAGATAYAGLEKIREEGIIGDDEIVVCLVTGNGLKDVKSAIKVAGEPVSIQPTLASFRQVSGSV
ncbi:MAG: threonine synthase [Candidatus Auribacterota bacterium]|nr:threonine synthase [Candidatus Auribacterota bacterium]